MQIDFVGNDMVCQSANQALSLLQGLIPNRPNTSKWEHLSQAILYAGLDKHNKAQAMELSIALRMGYGHQPEFWTKFLEYVNEQLQCPYILRQLCVTIEFLVSSEHIRETLLQNMSSYKDGDIYGLKKDDFDKFIKVKVDK